MKNRLRLLMALENINITQLAKKTGVSRNTVSSIYHERSKRIDLKTINTLCNFFQCTPNDIFIVTEKRKSDLVK